jgi:hypothetical protein
MNKDQTIQAIIDGKLCKYGASKEDCDTCYFKMHYKTKLKNDNETWCYLTKFYSLKKVENLDEHFHNVLYPQYKTKKLKRLLQ